MARLLPGLKMEVEGEGSPVLQRAELVVHLVYRSIGQLVDVKQCLTKDGHAYFRQWHLLPPSETAKNPSWGRSNALTRYAKESRILME